MLYNGLTLKGNSGTCSLSGIKLLTVFNLGERNDFGSSYTVPVPGSLGNQGFEKLEFHHNSQHVWRVSYPPTFYKISQCLTNEI